MNIKEYTMPKILFLRGVFIKDCIPIDDIFERIEELGYKGTMQFLKSPTKGVEQAEEDATYYKRRTKDQSEITLKELKDQSAEYIYNKIRMLQNPYPNAYLKTNDGKKVVFKRVEIEE